MTEITILHTYGKILTFSGKKCDNKIRPNKKICVFQVMSLKILSRVGTHIFFIIFFSGKKSNLCILKGI